MVQQKMHPDGVAMLIAAIVAKGDVDDLPLSPKGREEALKRAIDRRRRQVLELAREHYKVYPVDFDNSTEWRQNYARNGLNNLARLNRANLR